jgi:hypothetical protein
LTTTRPDDYSADTSLRTPRYLSLHHAKTGTRFRIFAQPRFIKFFSAPISVYVPARPGTIGAGPSDPDLYVVDALNKRPYFDGLRESGQLPPYRGRRGRAARPRNGHFDHIRPTGATARQFSSACLYATIRLTLAVWEHYLGARVRWYFRRNHRRLEVIPRVRARTAFSRPGYIECGFEGSRRSGRSYPLAENFDVVSHEAGHLIVRSVIGHPSHPGGLEQQAREEAFADLVAIVTLLHVQPAVARLLSRTRGNLFSSNLLSRIGEISRTTVARRATNDRAMDTLEWDANPRAFRYELAAPFSGAGYGALVDLYETALVARRAIPHRLADASFDANGTMLPEVQREFERRYRGREAVFEDALLEARDTFGHVLAQAWRRMTPYDSYPESLTAILTTARHLYGARTARVIREAFEWRGIPPEPTR